MHENRRKILNYIKKQKRGTWVEKISRELSICRTTVSRHIWILENSEEIEIEKMGGINMIFYAGDDGEST